MAGKVKGQETLGGRKEKMEKKNTLKLPKELIGENGYCCSEKKKFSHFDTAICFEDKQSDFLKKTLAKVGRYKVTKKKAVIFIF